MVWSLWFCGVGALSAGASGIRGMAFAWPGFKAHSFTSDSCSNWGTDIESCYVGSEKESQFWTVFTNKEKTLQRISSRSPEQDLVLSCLFVGGSGQREEDALDILGQAYISGIAYIFIDGNFVFQIHDLKWGK